MVYAIIPLEDSEDLEDIEDKVLAVDKKACIEEAPYLYFVSFSGTSRELLYALGYGDSDKSIMILRVHEYFGIASSQTWEWLEVRNNGQQ